MIEINSKLLLFFGYGSMFSTLIAIVLSCKRWKLQDPGFRVLRFSIIASLLFDLMSVLAAMTIKNNIWLSNLWQILQFCLFSLFYHSILKSKSIFTVVTLFLGFALADLSIIEGTFKINAYTTTVAAIIIIFYAILYFHKLLKDLSTSNLLSFPLFWVNATLLLYFSGNLVIYAVSNYIQTYHDESFSDYWVFTNIMNIIKNLLLSYSFLLYFQTQKLYEKLN